MFRPTITALILACAAVSLPAAHAAPPKAATSKAAIKATAAQKAAPKTAAKTAAKATASKAGTKNSAKGSSQTAAKSAAQAPAKTAAKAATKAAALKAQAKIAKASTAKAGKTAKAAPTKAASTSTTARAGKAAPAKLASAKTAAPPTSPTQASPTQASPTQASPSLATAVAPADAASATAAPATATSVIAAPVATAPATPAPASDAPATAALPAPTQPSLSERLSAAINQTNTNLGVGAASHASDLLQHARSAIGTPYRLGGTSADSGFDCSGFVLAMYQKAVGLTLPRTAAQQATAGHKVARDELKPGDLVFFNTLRRQFSHVGIYMGDGKFIHSPRKGARVRIENLNTSYWKARYDGARRVHSFEQPPAAALASAATRSHAEAPAASSSVIERHSPAPSNVRLGQNLWGPDHPHPQEPAAPQPEAPALPSAPLHSSI